MKFIELLEQMKEECDKRNREWKERSDFAFDDLCGKCKFRKKCDTIFHFGDDLCCNVPLGMDIENIKKDMKELGL